MTADNNEPTTYHQIPGASWKKVATQEARKAYDVMAVTRGSIGLEDLFGVEPEHFLIHRGDLHLVGPQRFRHVPDRDNRTIFVVDGSLTVDGALALDNSDAYTPLWVRGSLTATELVLACDACLFVEGQLEVKGVLVTDLSDAGHLVVHGATAAKAWIKSGGRGCVELGGKPQARIIGDGGDAMDQALRPDVFHGGDRFTELRDALLAGAPVLK
ncbi:MAG: hypothetical protein QM765_47995 [Myxococcales bacterium]